MEKFLCAVALIVLAGRALGIMVQRFRVHTLFGEVIAGILIGPILLYVTGGMLGISPSEPLRVLAEFSVLILMLLAGLTTDFKALAENKTACLAVGSLGVLTSFFAVFLPLHFIAAPVYNLKLEHSLLIAAVLSNTAIEVCARVFVGPEVKSSIRAVAIGASFVDDIMAVFLMGMVSTMLFAGKPLSPEELIFAAAKVILFIAFSLSLVSWLISRGFEKLKWADVKLVLTITILVAFLYALAARAFGLHEVIGVYLAGLLIGRWGMRVGPMLLRRVTWIKLTHSIDVPLRALFSPLFFTYIGITLVVVSLPLIIEVAPLILLLLTLALLGKLAGCSAAAKTFGFDTADAITVGVGMCGRGALELILLNYCREAGLLTAALFSALVFVTILTIVITPLLYTIIRLRGA
jgi:Kef-type K+ transport system membrane component KefB